MTFVLKMSGVSLGFLLVEAEADVDDSCANKEHLGRIPTGSALHEA